MVYKSNHIIYRDTLGFLNISDEDSECSIKKFKVKKQEYCSLSYENTVVLL